uniref:Ig-like domain-containing protein n=1 Tax=Romanomermis culicivorax TaxID=13658 RepID=A0A915KK52_ROMCU
MIELQCDVSRLMPNATVNWHKGGLLLNELEHERIREVGSKLIIRPAQYVDHGFYKCDANDGMLSGSQSFSIEIISKPCLHVLVQETASPWSGQSFKLLCDVPNVDYPVSDYKWYKNRIIIDYVKSKIYDVVGASMDDTGKYSCEIQYFNVVFKSPELEITVKAEPQLHTIVHEGMASPSVHESFHLLHNVENLDDPISHYKRYKDGIRVDQILDESYDSTVKVALGVAISDHQYERLVKFGKYGPVTGLNKKLLEQKIAKIMALNDSKIHHINIADAVEKSIAEFEEDQTDDQVGTKNILVILRKSIECNDCDNTSRRVWIWHGCEMWKSFS